MEDTKEIKKYLLKFNGNRLCTDIKERLKNLKVVEVEAGNELGAKEIWCVEQIYKVIQHYLNTFKLLTEKKFFAAWCELERTDVYCKIKVQTCAKNLYRVLHYFCA